MLSVQDAYRGQFKPDRSPTGFQVWSWFFMRISGLVLVFLVLGHMAIMNLIDGGVERIDYNFVAARWSGFFWRTYDWLLLALALTHGALGARLSIQDHLRKPGLRLAAKVALYSIVAFLFVVGTLTLATFDASRMPGGG